MKTSDVAYAPRPGPRLLGRPAFAGCLAALLMWWPALTPSLIPRTWATQALIGGVALALAYGFGTLAGYLFRRLLPSTGSAKSGPWPVFGIACALIVPCGAGFWMRWQNGQRDLMGMEVLSVFDAVLTTTMSLLLATLLVLAGRAIGRALTASTHVGRRMLPDTSLGPLAGPAVLGLGALLLGYGAWLGFTAYAHMSHGALNATTDEGATQPYSPALSGSSSSLIPWNTLGRWGRNFVSSATTLEDLRMFYGPGAELAQPVRVYVGLTSAGSVKQRAELAVRELDRAGGFDREVLAVWVPTGTGWMIPEAAEALETLHRGDTAIVAVQYSSLPSLISVFVDPGAEIETASALFAAVHRHWSNLPADRRPRLVLFGKSLGTAGVEALFAGPDASTSIGRIVARTDGILLVGAKHSNPIHAQVTRGRDPGSPVWQPLFENGRSVRFLSRDADRPASDSSWRMPRIAYLQHPSDPVPFWGIEALWRPPEWMDRPRGFDVPDAAGWYPIATALHAVNDLLFQLSTPPGFGHVYSTDYARGWASVLPPPGWNPADTERLERFVHAEGAAETEL